jgi:DNA-binding LacI/PurR family transcriptional regulator
MSDVAALAGVSAQTVSRVVHGYTSVTSYTRKRVLTAIDALGYRPNNAARALVTGRTRTLGVLMLDSAVRSPVTTLYGIEEAALESQYYMTVANLRAPNTYAIREAISRLVDQGVEGVVVLAPLVSVTETLTDLAEDLPVVAVEGAADPSISVVTVDPCAGALSATQYLLDHGRHNVWHVAGPTDWLESAPRTQGWLDGLACRGIEAPPLLRGDWSPRSGFDAGLVLARMPEVTAVFVANDSTAIGVLRAFYECGRAVPGDVSVVGFDDIPEAAYLNPPLMTVRQDFREVGRRSLEMLLERIQSAACPARREVVETSLVIRASGARGG